MLAAGGEYAIRLVALARSLAGVPEFGRRWSIHTPHAHAVIHALRARLAPTCVPAGASDRLRLSFCALTAHFGQWARQGRARVWQVAPGLLYGQVQKRY